MTPEEALDLIGRWDFDPGKGGTPRVPEWCATMFASYRGAVLSLADGPEDDAMLCYRLLSRLNETCDEIRRDGRDLLLPDLEREEANGQVGRFLAGAVRHRLEDGELPFSSSEVARVIGHVMKPNLDNGPAIAAFTARTLPAYREIDRYGRIAVPWTEILAGRARSARA